MQTTLYHLADAHFAFMYDAPRADEWVTLDFETAALEVRRDEIISIGAVRIAGNRLLTSQRLELLVRPECALKAGSVRLHRLREQDVALGIYPAPAMRQLLDFIGSRPLVGYFLEFDVAMLNREIWPLLGVRMPQKKIEVAVLHYDFKNRQLLARRRTGTHRLASGDHDERPRPTAAQCPRRAQRRGHGRGLAFVKLRGLLAQR